MVSVYRSLSSKLVVLMTAARSRCCGESVCGSVPGRSVGVDAHQLEVADVAVGALHPGPQTFSVRLGSGRRANRRVSSVAMAAARHSPATGQRAHASPLAVSSVVGADSVRRSSRDRAIRR